MAMGRGCAGWLTIDQSIKDVGSVLLDEVVDISEDSTVRSQLPDNQQTYDLTAHTTWLLCSFNGVNWVDDLSRNSGRQSEVFVGISAVKKQAETKHLRAVKGKQVGYFCRLSGRMRGKVEAKKRRR
jgi:hypothetical protein